MTPAADSQQRSKADSDTAELEHLAVALGPILPLFGPRLDGTCECGDLSCSSVGKHPITKHDQASRDPAVIRRWKAQHPTASWGIATGTPDGIAALDVDAAHGGFESLPELERRIGPLPQTVRSLTGGGGTHMVFRHPAGMQVPNRTALAGLPGLDFRGTRGLIVIPPSRHKSGRSYEWDLGAHPDDTPVAPLPDALRDLIVGKSERQPHSAEVPRVLTEGRRNDQLFSVACSVRRRGLEKAEIIDTIASVNRARCSPPLDDRELEDIAESAMRYKPADNAFTAKLNDEQDATRLPRLRTRTFADLMNASTEAPPREILQGHGKEGDVVITYGYSATGKSLYALEEALAISRGEKFLDTFETIASRVGVIDEESGDPRRLGRRLAQLARSRGIDPADDRLPVFSVGGGVRLDTEQGLSTLFDWIAENDLAVLVIDTLRRVHRLKENEADDMAKIEAAIKYLQRRVLGELGRAITIFLIHHSPKPREGGGNTAETMARGSSDIFAGVDAAFYIRKGKERGQLIVENPKARWSEPQTPYMVRIEGDEDQIRLVYGGTIEDTASQQERAKELARSVLQEGSGPRAKEELVLRAKVAKVSKTTLERALKALEESGDVTAGRSGKQRTYELSDAGILR